MSGERSLDGARHQVTSDAVGSEAIIFSLHDEYWACNVCASTADPSRAEGGTL